MKAIENQLHEKQCSSPNLFPIVLLLIMIGLLLVLSGCTLVESTQSSRQAEVAARGAEVMPFDLEQTMYIFTPRDNGGLQQVVVKEDADSEQIALIRAHLRKEAEQFRAGNFTDPGEIHGREMPGLTELREHNGRIEIRYSELPNGAQIEYITDDTQLIEAIHHWFQAQVMDHGSHARQ